MIITLEGNGDWCNFVYNNIAYYDSKEISYNGVTIPIRLNVTQNTNEETRTCNLKIQSYYGGLRDTVEIMIEQTGTQSAPTAHVEILQDYPYQITQNQGNEHEPYYYHVTMSVSYSNLHDNYDCNIVTISPDWDGRINGVDVFKNNNYIREYYYFGPEGGTINETAGVAELQNAVAPFKMYYDDRTQITVHPDFNVDINKGYLN